jgi:hypothetical protein
VCGDAPARPTRGDAAEMPLLPPPAGEAADSSCRPSTAGCVKLLVIETTKSVSLCSNVVLTRSRRRMLPSLLNGEGKWLQRQRISGMQEAKIP